MEHHPLIAGHRQALLVLGVRRDRRYRAGQLVHSRPVHHWWDRPADLLDDSVDGGHLMAQAVERWLGEAHARDIALRCQVAPDLPPIHTDPRRLSDLFSRLVRRAVSITPTGGMVFVAVLLGTNGTIEFRVEDQGAAETRWRVGQSLGPDSHPPSLAEFRTAIIILGGRLWMSDRQDNGNSVNLTQPIADPPAVSPVDSGDLAPARRTTIA